jgi:hypothetical protein
MTFVLKATGPADILAMVPALVGFAPRNSIVLIAFRGTRTCGALRFDLPPHDSRTTHKRIASFVIGMLCKIPDVDAVIPVICTDDEFAGGAAIPRREFAELLGRRIELSGFELRGSLCLAADGWASYLVSHVPAGGHPLSEIENSPAAAAIPEHFKAEELEQGRVPDADPATVRRVKKQLANLRRVYDRMLRDDPNDAGPDPAEFEPLADIPLLVEEALTWDDGALAANDALLLFALQGPPVRDHTMLQWATSLEVGDRMWRDLVREGGPEGDVNVGDLMFGIGPRPDPARIARGIELLLTLVSRVSGVDRLAPLCMLAWLNWALGRGTLAGRHIEEARAIQADYSMAMLLDSMFSNGLMPEWAFRS